MARPDIPSSSLARESGGAQLLANWLMALWKVCAFPAEPLLSPADAIDETLYFHGIAVVDDAASDTPPLALCDCAPA